MCVKDFSGTTAPRILKFDTIFGYDLLYRVKEKWTCCCLSFPSFVHFSFSPLKLFVTEFSAPIIARVFKFCVHHEKGQVYCEKENQDSVVNLCHFFSIFPFFSISHSNVMHREICVKDFSGTTAAKDFEICNKCWVWLIVFCKRESSSCCLSLPYLSIFLSLQANFMLQIS